MNADTADAARDINLTGQSMGQLRTANNRRNRAVRNTIGRIRAANEIVTGKPVVAPAATAKSKRTTS
jgi:hypothetical protein